MFITKAARTTGNAIAGLKNRRVRRERLRLLAAAEKIATRDTSDERAKEELRDALSDYSDAAFRAVLGRLRNTSALSYVGDRAYRLLDALVASMQVGPPPPERQAQFTLEAELGRMPMKSAFAILEELQPNLAVLREMVESWNQTAGQGTQGEPPDTREQIKLIKRGLTKRVGPQAESPNPVVRSSLAVGLVFRYLLAVAGDTRLGGPDLPYFQAPSTLSGILYTPRTLATRDR